MCRCRKLDQKQKTWDLNHSWGMRTSQVDTQLLCSGHAFCNSLTLLPHWQECLDVLPGNPSPQFCQSNRIPAEANEGGAEHDAVQGYKMLKCLSQS